MNGIIILDGQDASGKTTLAENIIKWNNGNGVILHATYRFKNKMPLYHTALLKKAIKLSKTQLVILDRLHISEYIYAKVYRGGTKWPWMLDVFNTICKILNIPIILCIPETYERGLVWFEQAKKERPEMYEDIKEIIKEYCVYAYKHKYDKNIIIYNRDFAQFYKKIYTENIKNKIFTLLGEQKNG